ncbi:hypothetical protein MACH15_15760 [Maricaulis maris]|nr:hypothetical protein MACH15_15760 [Maricaulis maris]
MRFDIGCADIWHECGFSGARRHCGVGVSRGAAARKGQAGKGRYEIFHGSLPQRGDLFGADYKGQGERHNLGGVLTFSHKRRGYRGQDRVVV